MPSINRVQIMGYLGQDPETRYLNSGTAVTSLSIATSKSWKDKQTGEQKEATEWHRVSLFGRQAEVAAEYLNKGSLVMIDGELRTRKWQDKEGNDRWTTEIVANPFGGLTLLPNKGGGGDGQSGPRQQAPASEPETPKAEDLDDDIPF